MIQLLALCLLLTSCGVALEDGLATPIDEYCFPGLCNTNQICMRGQCFDPCKTDDQCPDRCCAYASDDKSYCAPNDNEVCR